MLNSDLARVHSMSRLFSCLLTLSFPQHTNAWVRRLSAKTRHWHLSLGSTFLRSNGMQSQSRQASSFVGFLNVTCHSVEQITILGFILVLDLVFIPLKSVHHEPSQLSLSITSVPSSSSHSLKLCPVFFLSFFLSCSSGIRGLMHARQLFYH